MKKILFVTGNLDRGGAQRVLGLLANYYCANGSETHVAMLFDNKVGYEIHPELILHDVSCRGSYIKNLLPMIRKLRSVIIKVHPDVIVSFAGRINMVTMLASCGTGVPVIVSERNDPANDRRSTPERFMCKAFYSKANKVVFQTQYQATYYKKWCGKNGTIIGNPISAPVYEGEHVRKDIICAGKLMAQKNHPMMIEAFAQIKDEFPDKQVFIYGEGPDEEKLQAMIDEKRLTDRIHLCGNTDKMFDIMHEYQYFVMCSDYEGLSNALLEAMISGMTCITTAWSGVEEIIVDGENGYLVPVGDAKALAEKIKFVMQNNHVEINKNGIVTAKHFDKANVLNEWKNMIDDVVEYGGV